MAERKNIIDTLTGLIYGNTEMDWPGSRFYAVVITDNLDACMAARTVEDFAEATDHDIATDIIPALMGMLAELGKLEIWQMWLRQPIS